MRLTNTLRRVFPLMPALGCAHAGRICIAAGVFCVGAGLFCMPAPAQQLIGYVNTRDAEVTGSSDTLNGQTVLTGSVGVTAKDRPAPILLGRGGTARVCQSSVLHITGSRVTNSADNKNVNGTGATNAPLLFSLESGAIEIQMNGTASDAIMTPDLRFSVLNQGTLDLRVRVARNGDTCVENRGTGAPTLAVSDPFGESMYEVPGGQHVLFQHGSLHDVVDNESEPCGCPAVAPGMSVGDALLASGGANQGPTLATAPTPAPPPPVVVQVVPQVVVAPVNAATNVPAEPANANSGGNVPQVVVVPASAPAAGLATSPANGPPAPSVITQAAAPAVPQARMQSAAVPAAVATAAPANQAARPAPSPASVASPMPDAAAQQAALQAAEETAAQAAIRAAEARHPFPAEVSEAQPAEAPPAESPRTGAATATGQSRVQISDSMSYNAPALAAAAQPAAKPAAQPAPAAAPAVAKPAAPPTPVHRNVFQSIGHFFKWMFVG